MKLALTAREIEVLDLLRLARMKLGWAAEEAEGDERRCLRRAWVDLDNLIKRMEE